MIQQGTVQLRVRVRDNQNKWSSWSNPIKVKMMDQSNENINTPPAATFKVQQNYPNPFNPVSTIKYELAEAMYVSLKIFNSLGEEVATLIKDEYQVSGIHSEIFFANSTLPSGVYFYCLQAGDFVETKKMILLK